MSYEWEGFLLAQEHFIKWRVDRVGDRRVWSQCTRVCNFDLGLFCGIIIIKFLSSIRAIWAGIYVSKRKMNSFWCAGVCGLPAEVGCTALCKEGKPEKGKTEPFLVSALASPHRSSSNPKSCWISFPNSLLACFFFPSLLGGWRSLDVEFQIIPTYAIAGGKSGMH